METKRKVIVAGIFWLGALYVSTLIEYSLLCPFCFEENSLGQRESYQACSYCVAAAIRLQLLYKEVYHLSGSENSNRYGKNPSYTSTIVRL